MSIFKRVTASKLLSRRRVVSIGSAGLFAAAGSASSQARGANANAAEASAATGSNPSVEDRLAIEDLIYRYGIALDSLDKTSWEACWAPGAIRPEQVDEGMEYHRKYAHTMHNVLNHSYKVQENAATGVAYCVASMVKSDAGKLSKFDVYLMYRDELVKQNGEWRFSKRNLEVVFSTEAVPVQPGAPLLGLPFKPGSLRARPALSTR